jgi:hypothetical protein
MRPSDTRFAEGNYGDVGNIVNEAFPSKLPEKLLD